MIARTQSPCEVVTVEGIKLSSGVLTRNETELVLIIEGGDVVMFEVSCEPFHPVVTSVTGVFQDHLLLSYHQDQQHHLLEP